VWPARECDVSHTSDWRESYICVAWEVSAKSVRDRIEQFVNKSTCTWRSICTWINLHALYGIWSLAPYLPSLLIALSLTVFTPATHSIVLTELRGCGRRSLSLYGSLYLSPSLSVYLSLCMHTHTRPHSHTLEILNKHEKLLVHKSIRHFSLRQKNVSQCHYHRQTHEKQQMPSWLAHKATNTNSILFLSLLLCLSFSLSLSPSSGVLTSLQHLMASNPT